MSKTAEKSELIDFIEKEFGKGICVTGKQFVERKYEVIPFSPVLDMALGGGIPEGSFCVFTGPPKVGKGLVHGSKVFTPYGYKLIEDIKNGDFVCSPYGKSTSVIGVYPQGEKPCYKITFDDSNYVLCDEDHLWKVKSRDRKDWSVIETKNLGNLYTKEGRYQRLRWVTPIELAYFEPQNIPLEPYLLGVLIGDGCIINTISFSSIDEEIINKISDTVKQYDCYVTKKTEEGCDYRISKIGKHNNIKNVLISLELFGKKSYTKFIPKQYLYNSIDVRTSILKGLMDTDGSVDERGNIEFTTTSEQLAKDVKFLTESLGGLCKMSSRYTTYTYKEEKKTGEKSYRLRLRSNNPSMFFSLKRKLCRIKARTKKPLNRKIRSVESIGNLETTCIKVDSADGLFFTDNFVVTHNTTSALDFAGTCQKYPWFNKKGEKNDRHVMFLNIEGRLKDRDLKGIKSLNFENTTIIRSEEGNILSAEKYMEIAEQAINQFPGLVVVVDSFSSLCTDARRKGNLGDRFRDDTPLLIANFCKRIANVIPVNKTILIGITHMIANQGNGPAQWLEASGRKLQYQVDVKLKASHCEDWMAGTSQIGQKVHWECITSAIGAPGMKVTSYLKYGYGLDKGAELVEMAADMGIIEKKAGGGWYTFPDGTKIQGVTAAADVINSNPELFKQIYDNIATILGFKRNEGTQPE